tara:strand:- start:6806 stop:7165 length:360 start_codon:yes stop_codon:yes gene_type:complete
MTGFRKIVESNDSFFAIRDNYPVSKYHTLLIPKRHVTDIFNLYGDETLSLFRLLQRQKITLKEADNTITGFNVGFNSGCDAGQTIEHAHVHLIPRRKDDVEDPIGGIRNVFPGKGNYKI